MLCIEVLKKALKEILSRIDIVIHKYEFPAH